MVRRFDSKEIRPGWRFWQTNKKIWVAAHVWPQEHYGAVVGQRAGNEKRAEAAFVVNMSLDFRPEESLEI